MIEAELHFFQIKIEVFAAHSVVAFQLSLSISPEVLDAVNVVASAHGKALLMIDAIMLEAIQYQPVIRAKAVGVDDAFRNDFRLDDLAQGLARDILDDPGINFAIAFKKPENRHFPGCATPPLAFALAPEVTFVALDFAAQRVVQFTLTREAATDDLIDALGTVAVNVHHFRGATCWNFEGEVFNEFIELTISQLTVFN